MNDDGQLIDQTLQGNPNAFNQLVRKYQDRLYNTMLYVVGGREEAEDVVQDAFVQAFVKLETFHRQSAFYTWLYRIAFNQALSRRRRKRDELSVEQNREETGHEPLATGEAPEERLLRDERATQVQAALAAMNDEHRTILVLREMEGCDYDTISELLGLPIGTVRSRLHRARVQLKEQLAIVLQENPSK